MADLPNHPDTGGDPGPGLRPGEPVAGPTPRRKALWITLATAALVLFVVLHLTGVVGAGSHG